MLIRQGDVLLKPIKKLPDKISCKDNILAYGEITGHHHRFDKNALGVQVFIDSTETQFCVLEQDSVLKHEDHANIEVPKGTYQVVIQREIDLVSNIERQVID